MDDRPCSTEPELWFGYADDDASDGAAKPTSTSNPPPRHEPFACVGVRLPSNGSAPGRRSKPARNTACGLA